MQTPHMFRAQVFLMFDLKSAGAKAVAKCTPTRRWEIHSFLNTDIGGGQSEAALREHLSMEGAFKEGRIRSIADPTTGSLLPRMNGSESVTAMVEAAGKSIARYIRRGFADLGEREPIVQVVDNSVVIAYSGLAPESTLVERLARNASLDHDYTCKQRVWDPTLNDWVWEYNYTLLEFQGTTSTDNRLAGTEVTKRLLKRLVRGTNAPDGDELTELALLAPTFRLACVVNGRARQ